MDLKAALAKLKQIDAEGVAELVSAIEAGVSELDAKVFTVVGEKRAAISKQQALEAALVAVGKAVGIEGDTDKLLAEIEPKVRGVAGEASTLRTEKETLSSRAVDAETKLKTLERTSKVAELAAKAGANPTVLQELLGDRVEELKLEGDEVRLGDKPLKEAIVADEKLKLYEGALFPIAPKEETQKSTTKLPNGSPKGKAPEGANPITGYIQRNSRLKTLAQNKQT